MPSTLPRIKQEIGRLLRWHESASHDGRRSPPVDEQPLRAELYSVHQLEHHAKGLAGLHQIAVGRAPDRLIARLNENERILIRTYDLVVAAVEEDRRVSPAAEWLLDNFYVVEEQIRTARRHLPRSYSRSLPRLAKGPSAGFPRAYGIALDLISHVDGGVDALSLGAFIASYQTITPLTLGELWAVPIMLRLALLENLRRVAVRLAASLHDRSLATEWAQRMVDIVEENPTDLVLVLADMARANPPLTSAFLAELTRHLHGQSPHFAFALSWLEHRLSEQGQNIGQLVQIESQVQAADQVSIGNSITSLRFLSSTDWREFVEGQSVVEQTLRRDPSGVYARMSFATRDLYRHAVEETAKRSDLTEGEVARRAVQLAEVAHGDSPDSRTAHVGYYLLNDGLGALEQMTSARLTPRVAVARAVRRYPLFFYLSGIALVTVCVAVPLSAEALYKGLPIWALAAISLPALMCVGHVGVGIANWMVTLFVQPQPLARMDFRSGIPPEHRTMVVVPTMLSSVASINELIEGLEIRYLANRDRHLHFALLTDFKDAAQETMPDDDDLVRHAWAGVDALNRKYETERRDIFFLFHRPRRWNEQEGVWMGYERKRGKLKELNALLRGGAKDSFSHIVGNTGILPQVRYVLTLDMDTQLPRDAARELVGTMAHPLNRPQFDAERGRVVDGYSILQPRVGVSLPSASRSWFVRLFAPDSGLDPYTRVVSDVYQDLFGEGSFVGKGLYDVDTFDRACANHPDNAILSHDLLESAYARSALVTDVELYEDHPSSYTVDMNRRHRWIRGDWQIAWWLLPRVPGANGHWVPNPISWLSWWKIFDNLRRSLMPVAMLLLLSLGWVLRWGGLAADITLFVVAILATPLLVAIVTDVVRKPKYLPLWMHVNACIPAAARQGGHVLFTLTFLPYDAYCSLGAIARTLVRMLITRRKLLQWTTSREVERRSDNRLLGFIATMWIGPVLAAAIFALIYLSRPAELVDTATLLVLWVVSPGVAWWLSRPFAEKRPQLSAEQNIFLRKLARRTWRYFEVFVCADDNWLPPDNYQEHPVAAVAPRTSPTNIGASLLANLAAYDFGYCSVGQLLERIQKTFVTLTQLERYRGHLYNWYDTRTLKPLPPHYVSTVDSGNLAGHLLVLRRGLLELIDAQILPQRAFVGVQDTARVLLDIARDLARKPEQGVDLMQDAVRKIERLDAESGASPHTLTASAVLLQRLALASADIRSVFHTNVEFLWWAEALDQSIAAHRDDVAYIAPWTLLASPPERLWLNGAPDRRERLDALRDQLDSLENDLTLRQISTLKAAMLPVIDAIMDDSNEVSLNGIPSTEEAEVYDWLASLRQAIVEASRNATQRIRAIEYAAHLCDEFADMDFLFLFDKARDLFSIGYNVVDHRLDTGYYDLLASEARLASYVAIAQGQLSQEHWFALGRILTTSRGAAALLSWSGSMFEYLMPLLVMPTYENTLLDQTYKAVVWRQIVYGKQRKVPWGVSESGYNALGIHLDYQYRAFGVPGLGLKRGLADDLVVAPYATVMALMVAPEVACRNLERLAAQGVQGPYGFFEAIDYTPSRVPPGATSAPVRSFMAHHQGMSLLSLAYLLLGRPMQRRFMSDPALQATDLLLQERVPKAAAPIFPHAVEASVTETESPEAEGTVRVLTDPGEPIPEVHLLSNGRCHVMVSSAGGGYTRWNDMAVTRWREDATRDCWGAFCYVRDVTTGRFWSSAYHPTLRLPKTYEAIFSQAKAEFRRRDDDIETHTEISVSPEDDIELRRITISNQSEYPRTIELTSYAEVVLAPAAQDLAHPAFSNLFVQTELVRSRHAIFCTRRPRSAGERPPWMVHLMTVQGTDAGETSFETDRMRFVGRGRTLADPAAMRNDGRLSDSEGPVLDPMVSIRRTIRIEANETARIDIVTGIGETREAVTALMEKYHDPRLADRVFELAWTHSLVQLRHLNATEAEAQIYSRLASSVIFATSLCRSGSAILARNRRGQSGLWGHGISGDLPIVLVRIRDKNKLALVRQAFQAHSYWRMKGLIVDLVIWNEDDSVYRQELHDAIMSIIAASPAAGLIDKNGGVFVRRGEQISEEDRVLLQAVARVVLTDDAGSLAEQVEWRGRPELTIPNLKPIRRRSEEPLREGMPTRDLAFFNGTGGFTHDGREYITLLRPGQNTPLPWSNVIANREFGTLVSESGSVYSWAENSHEYRLTPWFNDAVSGECGEAVYIRDEESGRFWSPSPLPARGTKGYVIRHGFGYSVFEYEEDGIASEFTVYVAMDAPVKVVRVKLMNRSGRTRRLSVTGYWELVLGDLRSKTAMHVITEIDLPTSAVFARNPYSSEFDGKVVFAATSESMRTVTGDRAEFLGRNGTPANPAALRRTRLSGRVGAGLDPCVAIQTYVQVEEGQEREIVFVFGAANSTEHAQQLVRQTRGAANVQRLLEGVWEYWSRTLGVVYVETPDASVNFLANGWLIYQTLSCRMWGRTGFYQSGGAYGFRDQVQDAMALLHAEPAVLREHLLRAAAHQFREGDVQHWWHPPSGRGVRTHFSDDYLWLPYATCHYVAATGDIGVLEELVPFLTGRAVRPEEESYYDLPHASDETGTLYEHCARAVKNALRFGEHGLPLMGSGDWNDGMNLVGQEGKGESVWLGFFLYDVLGRFAHLADRRADEAFAMTCRTEAEGLRARIEREGWDGHWYRRAFFDNGEPLGSASNAECQIDSIPQSWAVLSGAGIKGHVQKAMDSVDQRLVRRDTRLIQLFDPPFDTSPLDPGYIKGYIPGVRENGGQYTHAAIWAIMAFAALGDTKRAWELLALINPINHGSSPGDIQVYKAEPYVIAADVYAVPPHTGRGGWTWYTGAAGWMYRLITESLLGLHLEVDKLRFTPCIPVDWEGFRVHYRYRETFYHIAVHNSGKGKSVVRVTVDGVDQKAKMVPLRDDRVDHQVEIDIR